MYTITTFLSLCQEQEVGSTACSSCIINGHIAAGVGGKMRHDWNRKKEALYGEISVWVCTRMCVCGCVHVYGSENTGGRQLEQRRGKEKVCVCLSVCVSDASSIFFFLPCAAVGDKQPRGTGSLPPNTHTLARKDTHACTHTRAQALSHVWQFSVSLHPLSLLPSVSLLPRKDWR